MGKGTRRSKPIWRLGEITQCFPNPHTRKATIVALVVSMMTCTMFIDASVFIDTLNVTYMKWLQNRSATTVSHTWE